MRKKRSIYYVIVENEDKERLFVPGVSLDIRHRTYDEAFETAKRMMNCSDAHILHLYIEKHHEECCDCEILCRQCDKCEVLYHRVQINKVQKVIYEIKCFNNEQNDCTLTMLDITKRKSENFANTESSKVSLPMWKRVFNGTIEECEEKLDKMIFGKL